MIFEAVGGIVLKKLGEIPMAAAISSVKAVLVNEKALASAKNVLRAKYEEAIAPASYDFVTDNLALVTDDFKDYFKAAASPSRGSLRAHLRQRLVERSQTWVNNRPSDELMSRLIDDFLDAYEAYFVATDPHLTSLSLTGIANDVLEVVVQIRDTMEELARERGGRRAEGVLARDIMTLLNTSGVPFEVVERGAQHIDAVITDPSSLFPVRFYLFATDGPVDERAVDSALDRARIHGRISHLLLVTDRTLPFDLVAYAERRGVVIHSTRVLRDTLSRMAPPERYVVGAIAASALVDAYHLRDVFIDLDAVQVEPGDDMEHTVLSRREPVRALVKEFLEDDEQRVLVIFGGYGAGKSSLCAHLTASLPGPARFTPVYVPLRHLQSGEDLVRVVTKADQLAKTVDSDRQCSVVLLDGLDELPDALQSDQKRHNLLRLLQSAARTDKLIVTARTSYFRGLEDFWDLFARSHNHPLWNEMARFITESQVRPKVRAVILREFDSHQIETYLAKVAVRQGTPAEPVTLHELDRSDSGGSYRLLARNPLYLFLMAHTLPWRNQEVGCFAEVLIVFIKYWFTRDIEKGQSRWLMGLEDRLQFGDAVAWWMFRQDKAAISFDEFDQLVGQHFGSHVKGGELSTLALDLQTTGVLGVSGRALTFICPAFMDYFVAARLLKLNNDSSLPNRMPSQLQTQLLAGICEVENIDLHFDPTQWLRRAGVKEVPDLFGPLQISTENILYGGAKRAHWLRIDPPPDTRQASVRVRGHWRVRVLTNAAVLHAREEAQKRTSLLVVNKLGLHARASAKVVRRYMAWAQSQAGLLPPKVFFARERAPDAPAYLAKIMDVMSLAAAQGTVLLVSYENCSRDDVELLLHQLGCMPASGTPGQWDAHFDWVDGDEINTPDESVFHRRV